MGECKLLDLREHEGRYYFRLGDGADFIRGLGVLKNEFHWSERKWGPDSKEWSVPATPTSEGYLCTIFPNGKSAFTALHTQLRLF